MASLGAEPDNLVGRGSNQQVLRGGWREADLQSRVKSRTRCVQNTDVHMEQLGAEKNIPQASEQKMIRPRFKSRTAMKKKGVLNEAGN